MAVPKSSTDTYDRLHPPFLGYALLYPLGFFFHQYFESFEIQDSLILRFLIGIYCILLFICSAVPSLRRLIPYGMGLLHIFTLVYSFALCHLNELGLSYTIGLTLIIASTISASRSLSFIRAYLAVAITSSVLVIFLTAENAHIHSYLFFLATGAIGLFAYSSRQTELSLLRELELANEEKAAFLNSMSHEVRNSLNGIIPVMDLLQTEEDADRRMELLSVGRRSGRFLLNLISEVLDLSKMEAGRFELQSESFLPSHVLDLAVQTYQVQAQASGTNLTWSQEGQEQRCLGDATRMGQILNNLIGNAVKFTGQGKVQAMLSVRSEGNTLSMAFIVQDSGPGIPEDQRERIFDEYNQLKTSGWNHRGTGLGLALSRRLAESMGGSISVTSSPADFAETGSRFEFHIELPVDRTVLTASQTSETLHYGLALIVDDDPVSCLVMENLLSRMGFQIHRATDLSEANDFLRSNQYDYVFLDFELGEQTGADFLRSLRNRPEEETYILVTAHSGSEVANDARSAGFKEILTKPIDLERLRVLLREGDPEK